MHILRALIRKERKVVVGLMSGTSVDGIDAVVAEIRGAGRSSRVRQLGFCTLPYPRGYKEYLLRNSAAATARLDEIARLDMLVASFFADAARRAARRAGLPIDRIDLIGSHGQTIQHLPAPARLFGRSVRATMQIGNPSVIAKLTGVVTVGDFRVGDVAVGGSGAPLVPLFDYLMLRSGRLHRAALNLGGIANVTLLPAGGRLRDVVAFDTGPASMVIDALMQRFFHVPYDDGGRTAARGKPDPALLTWMMRHRYLRRKPPKSTGREMFGEAFVREFVEQGRGIPPEDLVATATEFTALSICKSLLRFAPPRSAPTGELIVSGGGVHNRTLMGALARHCSGMTLRTSDQMQISADAKEALCFALLANETISGHPGNVPGATGAKAETILGVIALP